MADQEKKKYKGIPPVLRMVILVYILYIAYQLATELIAGKIPENQRIFVLISIVVFAVSSFWMLWVVYKEIKAQKAEEARQQAEDALLEPQDDEYADDDDDEEEDEKTLLEAPSDDDADEENKP